MSSFKTEKRNLLIALLQAILPDMKEKLEELKAGKTDLERDDFIWHFLLQSLSGMGNNTGYYGLIKTKENYERVTFEALSILKPEERLPHLKRVLAESKVRMPNLKAGWLYKNYDLIIEKGGLLTVKNEALRKKGKEEKIKYMMNFVGIGKKYARNIWMDVYHPDFHDSIAIDSRISKITEMMGWQFETYEEHERFYLDIAKEAGIQGWELDRLLFHFNIYFANAMGDVTTYEDTKKDKNEEEKSLKEGSDGENEPEEESKNGCDIAFHRPKMEAFIKRYLTMVEKTIDLLKNYEPVTLDKKLFPDYSLENSDSLKRLVGKRFMFSPDRSERSYTVSDITTCCYNRIQPEKLDSNKYFLNHDEFQGRHVILKEIYDVTHRNNGSEKVFAFEFKEGESILFFHILASRLSNFILMEKLDKAISAYKNKIMIFEGSTFPFYDRIYGTKFSDKRFLTHHIPIVIKVVDIIPMNGLTFLCETLLKEQFYVPIAFSELFHKFMTNNIFHKAFYIDDVSGNYEEMKGFMQKSKNKKRIGVKDLLYSASDKWYYCYVVEKNKNIYFKLKIIGVIDIHKDDERNVFFDNEILSSGKLYQVDMVVVNCNHKSVKIKTLTDSLVIADKDDFEFAPIKKNPSFPKNLYFKKATSYELTPKIEVRISMFFLIPPYQKSSNKSDSLYLKIINGRIKPLNKPTEKIIADFLNDKSRWISAIDSYDLNLRFNEKLEAPNFLVNEKLEALFLEIYNSQKETMNI